MKMKKVKIKKTHSDFSLTEAVFFFFFFFL